MRIDTMPDHSPAPWTVELLGQRHGIEAPSRYVLDANGSDVARVRGGEATSYGNAHAISVLPELLAVAQALIEADQLIDEEYHTAMAAVLKQAKAAVTKALGR